MCTIAEQDCRSYNCTSNTSKEFKGKVRELESEFENVRIHLCVLAREKNLGGHTTELEASLTHIPLNRPLWVCTVLADMAIACGVPE